MTLIDDLRYDQAILLSLAKDSHISHISTLIKSMGDSTLGYVTLSKTYKVIDMALKTAKVPGYVVYIDAISNSLKQAPSQTTSCYFVDSPANVSDLVLNMSRFTRHGFTFVIFDSISNLEPYLSPIKINNFLKKIIHIIHSSNTKAVFIIDKNSPLIDKIRKNFDKVIE